MSAPSVTYSFTNGTTSDATQVNTNFTDLINGASDGTRDYTIGTLTVQGASTFNGSVTLGDSSADDLTFTGSIASTIPYKTNATYNIGAATLAPLSIYLGNGTKSTRIMAGTVGTSWTLTLPNDVPAVTGKTAIFNTSGTMEFRYPEKFTASKTGAYTATGDETVIPCDASGAGFTVDLPAAASYTGKILTIIKTDSSFNVVTIDGNASETINGATTTTLNTQYEALTIACDGSNWYIIDRQAGVAPTSYTPTFAGLGTVSSIEFYWSRAGKFMTIQGTATCGTVSGTTASFTLPSTLTPDVTSTKKFGGFYFRTISSTNSHGGGLRVDNATNTVFFMHSGVFGSNAVDPASGYAGNVIFSNSDTFSVFIVVPITEWKA